jgi:hypothetical protein
MHCSLAADSVEDLSRVTQFALRDVVELHGYFHVTEAEKSAVFRFCP